MKSKNQKIRITDMNHTNELSACVTTQMNITAAINNISIDISSESIASFENHLQYNIRCQSLIIMQGIS